MNEGMWSYLRRLNRQVASTNWSCGHFTCDDLESLLEWYRSWGEHWDSIAAHSIQAPPGTGMKLLKEGLSDGLDTGSKHDHEGP